jgi:hypothetical protein
VWHIILVVTALVLGIFVASVAYFRVFEPKTHATCFGHKEGKKEVTRETIGDMNEIAAAVVAGDGKPAFDMGAIVVREEGGEAAATL